MNVWNEALTGDCDDSHISKGGVNFNENKTVYEAWAGTWQEAVKVWYGKITAEAWAKESAPKLQELYDKGNN